MTTPANLLVTQMALALLFLGTGAWEMTLIRRHLESAQQTRQAEKAQAAKEGQSDPAEELKQIRLILQADQDARLQAQQAAQQRAARSAAKSKRYRRRVYKPVKSDPSIWRFK